MSEAEDLKWMRLALAAARKREGLTRPNPPVGAAIVRDGRLIALGCHLRCGDRHAEANAFDDCAESPKGATLYVTLEPCSTTGHQPPCTERIIAEDIRRVVVAHLDVNPRHAGRGVEILRAAGIQVDVGVAAEEAAELAEGFDSWMTRQRPFLTLKLAMTLDGRVADRDGNSKWISGPESRARVQEMRRRSDAVLIGGGTAVADDPSLLFRGEAEDPEAGSKLLRVVVDTRGDLPSRLRIFTDAAKDRTIVACFEDQVPALDPAVAIWKFPRQESGLFPVRALLMRLALKEGCLRVLCEGGGRLAGQLRDEELVDEYALFQSPVLLGDSRARPAFSGEGCRLADAEARLCAVETRVLGDDVFRRLRADGTLL